ncbi:MAG: DUF2809 domain-containing protein [Clostridium sp.]
MKRNRIKYIILIIVVIGLGISSRKFAEYLPKFIGKYSGDVLWALMVFFMFGFLMNKRNTKTIAFGSLIFAYLIEASQLYQAEWINTIRDTRIGALVLGHGFLFSDLICYTIGVSIGVLIEIIYSKYLKSCDVTIKDNRYM